MAGDDKAGDNPGARAVAVIVLVLLAIVALRGYLPEAERAVEREPATGGPGSIIAVVAMLAVSIAVIVIAVVGQRRRAAAPSAAEPRREYRTDRDGLPWRLLLIAAAGLAVWLLVVLLLLRWGSPLTFDDVQPAAPEPGAPPQTVGTGTAPQADNPSDSGMFGYLAATTALFVAAAVIATMIGRRRLPALKAEPAGPEAPRGARPAGPDLARAAELGLAEIGDLSRDPREAIIACYAAMERELEKSPGTTPQDSDTPSEVLARAVERHALRADSASELVELFEEARFSPHVMNEGHREDAVRALRLVQRELQGAR